MAKSETLGTVSVSKLNAKDWKAYQEASTAFAKAKATSATAKEVIRKFLKSKFNGEFGANEELDFIVIGDKINILKTIKADGDSSKKRAKDLSDRF